MDPTKKPAKKRRIRPTPIKEPTNRDPQIHTR
jgi:hypothetical protein